MCDRYCEPVRPAQNFVRGRERVRACVGVCMGACVRVACVRLRVCASARVCVCAQAVH